MLELLLIISDSSSMSQCRIWVDSVQSSVPTLKKKRATWSEDSLVAAVRDVRRGLSAQQASRRHGIPRRTLSNHIHKEKIVKHLGRHSIFNADQERDFVSSVIKFSDLGLVPLTSKMIQVQAFAFCQKFNITNNFNKGSKMAGKGWLKMFLIRNPDLAMRKVQFINGAESLKLNKPVKEVLKLYDVLNLHDKVI